MSTINSMLGKKGEPVKCKVFSDEIAMHWFISGAKIGDKCLCGKTVKKKG